MYAQIVGAKEQNFQPRVGNRDFPSRSICRMGRKLTCDPKQNCYQIFFGGTKRRPSHQTFVEYLPCSKHIVQGDTSYNNRNDDDRIYHLSISEMPSTVPSLPVIGETLGKEW